MNKNRFVSDLKNHKYKKGLIQPPMNTLPNQQPVSWTNDRLPEYLWLGLILMNYDRTNLPTQFPNKPRIQGAS